MLKLILEYLARFGAGILGVFTRIGYMLMIGTILFAMSMTILIIIMIQILVRL